VAVALLVVEDESRIVTFLRRGLEADGFVVLTASDGPEGLRMALDDGVELVVLDLILPGLSGEEVLRRLRTRRPDVPVIVLTAKDAVSDRVANLNAGADDYVMKPFSYSELLARVHARLRGRQQPESVVLEVGEVSLDLHRREARRAGRVMQLTTREFTLLETLMRHPGQVLSQAQLLDRVWGYDFAPESNIAEVYVGYLRRKLGPDLIDTVRGAGYRFRGPG